MAPGSVGIATTGSWGSVYRERDDDARATKADVEDDLRRQSLLPQASARPSPLPERRLRRMPNPAPPPRSAGEGKLCGAANASAATLAWARAFP